MLISWEWLSQYVQPNADPATVGQKLALSGLNLETIHHFAGDAVLELEVTSNRPDCLGHVGVAREVAALFEVPLNEPSIETPTAGRPTSEAVSVRNDAPDACPRYIARVIRGAKVGPSPEWLRRRLEAIGQRSVNNIVDVTNYVLFEVGQPFHAFDLDKLSGGQIVIRHAKPGETFAALNQKDSREVYKLDPDMLVIADANRPVVLAGVMGGLESGVTAATTNIVLETAEFTPLAIRGTARKLALFSPSQYRFERGVDRARLDAASRRCAQLLLEVAGGELLEDPVAAGDASDPEQRPIRLRFGQISRLLGIDIPSEVATTILARLGLVVGHRSAEAAECIPPTWRRDLTREADLVEEIARIYGYEHIPDAAPVPLSLSRKSELDRVRDRVRSTLVAQGFSEALTLSFTTPEEAATFDPLPNNPTLSVEHSSRRHENLLRKSLIPSLLRCRRDNERRGSFDADLFEIAKTYLRAAPGEPERQVEPLRVAFVTGRGFAEAKGIVENIVAQVRRDARVTAESCELTAFAPGRRAILHLNGQFLGWLGRLDRSVSEGRPLELRDEVTVAELDFACLMDAAVLTETYQPVPVYPAIERDLNFVLDEDVAWSDLERVATAAAGATLEATRFAGQFRGQQLGAEKKSYVIRLLFRSPTGTLKSEAVDADVANVVAACERELNATLRA